jgi:hypothetical protein
MCPTLTQAEMTAAAIARAIEGSRALLGTGASALPPARAVEATRCQGPRCGFFIPIGTAGDGACSEKMKVTVAHSQNLLLEAIALKLGAIEKIPAPMQPSATTPT